MTALRSTIACLTTTLVLQMAVGQETGRQMQLGVKTTEPAVAVATEVSILLDEMGSAAERLGAVEGDPVRVVGEGPIE